MNKNTRSATLNVMLVDDDVVINRIHQYLLLRQITGLNLVTFTSPREALLHTLNRVPDYILLDINMPGMNGWEFLETLEDKGIDASVYILSSSIDPVDHRKAREFRNVKGFLIKPLTDDTINETIRPKDDLMGVLR